MDTIIFRYLAKEVLLTTLVVTLIVVFIFLSNTIVRLMSGIVDGQVSLGLFLEILLSYIPILVAYLLPVGLFIGILLSFGRMYADNEITVLQACGVSQNRLVAITLIFSSFVTLLVTILAFWIAPRLYAHQTNLLVEQSADILLQTLFPGRFQSLFSNEQVIYAQDISRDRSDLYGVFVAQLQKPDESTGKAGWAITTAEKASPLFDHQTGQKLMVAKEGYRYSGEPGSNDFQVLQFGEYMLELPEQGDAVQMRVKALPTPVIWAERKQDIRFEAEWQWRLSLPISTLLLAMIAVPLSRVKPRQGKYAKILPGTLIYIVYAQMIIVGRGWVGNGSLPDYIGLYPMHFVLFLLALFMLRWNPLKWLPIKKR